MPRMYRSMGVLAALGLIGFVWYGGAPTGIGFVVGAAFSAINFWIFHRVVSKLGENPPSGKAGSGSAMLAGLRYLVFGVAGYAILKSFEASILAALAGCFVAVAAVLLEAFYELIYGT